MSQSVLALLVGLTLPIVSPTESASTDEMQWVQVSKNQGHFVLTPSGCPFVPWGLNYDHDHKLRLLEDYWETEWPTVERHFQEMRQLGANVVRIHLQLGRFMESRDRPNENALARLARLVKLAEQTHLYLDLTGLGCYHRRDVPGWYDDLAEEDRWQVQARFWEAVAARCAGSPAIFCYDLMNEPVAPGAEKKKGDWLVGPPLGGKQFVQLITLDPQSRPRSKIAEQWVRTLAAAIRRHDRRHLITAGLLPGTPQRADAWSGFDPKQLAELDYISVHMYPKKGKVDEALTILEKFAVGKPVVIEETFPLSCSMEELEQFIDGSQKYASGWIGFYWGQMPDELRRSKEFSDTVTWQWLEFFQRKGKQAEKP